MLVQDYGLDGQTRVERVIFILAGRISGSLKRRSMFWILVERVDQLGSFNWNISIGIYSMDNDAFYYFRLRSDLIIRQFYDKYIL